MLDKKDLLRIFFFQSGGSYQVPAPPDTPTEDSPEMKKAAADAAEAERARARKASGRMSTILTGGMGVMGKPVIKASYLTGLRSTLGE